WLCVSRGERRWPRGRSRAGNRTVPALFTRPDAQRRLRAGTQSRERAGGGAWRFRNPRPPSAGRHPGNHLPAAHRPRTGGGVMDLLYVEDDDRVRRFVLRGLEAEGYAVTVATDGIEGMIRARDGAFDV